MIRSVPRETRVDYALRPPADAPHAENFTPDDGWVVTPPTKSLPVEEIRFDVAMVYGVGPEDVYLEGFDGLPTDTMEAYSAGMTPEAFAATRWNLAPSLEGPGEKPTLL